MCTLFISCNNVYEKFVILYTCLFGSERTPPMLILTLQVSLMPLVPTICLFWGGINIAVLGICNVAPDFIQASSYWMESGIVSFKSIYLTPIRYCQLQLTRIT